MMFTDEQKTMLSAPLDSKHVKKAPQGKYGEYVDGHHVISEANRIFDFAWSYVITSLEQCSRVETNGGDQIRIGYRCTVRVTVGDITREGAAVGVGIGKPANEADIHESAVKEAETDALKRALRSFGNTFGLALYDKGDNRAVAETPPAIVETFLNKLVDAYRNGDPAEYWTANWPSVPQDWRAYALAQKEQIKMAQEKEDA